MKDTYSSGKTVKIRFLDPKDRMEAINEFERLAHESMGGRTEFIQNWCAKNGLNYKTYEKWRLDDQGKNSINKKQRIRIEVAISSSFASVCNKCIDSSEKNLGYQELLAAVKYDLIQLETIWTNKDDDIKTTLNNIATVVEKIQELKKLSDKIKSTKNALHHVQSNIELITNAENIMKKVRDSNLYIHTGHVSEFMKLTRTEVEGTICQIVVSSAGPVRHGGKPEDVVIGINYENLI
ncbi:hypothetical protein N9495_03705 [Gammaproteobacteria bacterium]|jgi:hypothetical protein|nr:hypothetical protein [Gammaproteobacteria bacterium]